MCFFHGGSTDNDASCRAQCPNSTASSNAAAANADSSYVTEGMRAVWSTGLAKKYPHLLWALLNEPFEVKAPRAAKVVLTGHVALRVLKPKVARRALKFIYNGTIQATPIHKLPLEGKPSSLAVDALYHTIKQASPIPQPAPSIAMLPPMMMMSVQTLLAVAQQPPAAVATNSPTVGANTFGEMLHPVNVDVSIIEASPCPSATAPRSWKISVL
uniref:Uncharacterized protein n=1 Tax=Romanomermis culicivorax TaxID=13658 RepID=A0A915HTX7_ROMCU